MADPQTPVGPGSYYSTVEQVANDLNVTTSDSQYASVERHLAAATSYVTRTCNRSFFAVSETRLYTADADDPELLLGDTQSVTQVRVADRPGNTARDSWLTLPDTDWVLTGIGSAAVPYWVLTLTNPARAWPQHSTFGANGRELRLPNVEVEGRFGWAAVPAGIEEATRLIAKRYLSRHNAGTPDSEFYVDPDVKALLHAYTLHAGADLPLWETAPSG